MTEKLDAQVAAGFCGVAVEEEMGGSVTPVLNDDCDVAKWRVRGGVELEFQGSVGGLVRGNKVGTLRTVVAGGGEARARDAEGRRM